MPPAELTSSVSELAVNTRPGTPLSMAPAIVPSIAVHVAVAPGAEIDASASEPPLIAMFGPPAGAECPAHAREPEREQRGAGDVGGAVAVQVERDRAAREHEVGRDGEEAADREAEVAAQLENRSGERHLPSSRRR